MDTGEQYYKMCYEAFPEDREDGDVFKTQDQLQEMVDICECSDPYCLLIDFHKFVRGLPNPAPPYTDSMEQLWLAFVMSARYNKCWNGEEWVTVDRG